MAHKFNPGDLVHIAKDLGPMMRHFTADIDAIVIGSYQAQYGGQNASDYTLFLKGHGRVSWYHESQMELIQRGRNDLLDLWQSEMDADDKLKSDLDWIFAHGPEVLERASGASVAALGKCLGITNLWGSHGEGLAYYENSLRVLSIAGPHLAAKDKDGFLELCKSIHVSTVDYNLGNAGG